VRVTVDKPRQQQFATPVDGLLTIIMILDFGARANCNNRVARDDDRPIVVDVALAIHGDNHARDDCVGMLARGLAVETD